MDAKQGSIIALSVSAGLGVLTLLITCPLSSNWWPMLSLLVYALLPLSGFLTTIQNDEEDVNMWEHFGFCTGGFILSGLCGLPIILAHTGALNVLNRTTLNLTDELDVGLVAGWSVANVIIFAGALAFAYIAKRGD